MDMECTNCGVVFGIPDRYLECREKDKRVFYCPNGHEQRYGGVPEIAKLNREIESLKRQLESASGSKDYERRRADRWMRSARALQGVITKMRKKPGR